MTILTICNRIGLAAVVASASIGLSGCGREGGTEEAQSNPLAVAPIEDAEATNSGGRWFISAANPYAVDVGAEILAKGGTAVDAAIATQFVLGLVEPQSSGIGGGAFMMHFDPTSGALVNYDGREVAPASAMRDRFLKDDGTPMNYYDAVAGGLSIGVPGVVAMMAQAHSEHGRLPWADLLRPAQELATKGFEVSPRLHGLLSRIPRLKQMPAAAAYFYDSDGSPWPVGHTLENEAYAGTLGTLMEKGPSAFYEGEIAEAIVDAANAAPLGSGMTLADLAAYAPVKREPVCGPYRALTVCSMGPPSSGGVTLLQILALLERFDLAGAGAGSVEALHLIFEASRLAYADRAEFLADYDPTDVGNGISGGDVVAALLNPTYLADRTRLIDRAKVVEEVDAGEPFTYALPDGPKPGDFPEFARDASPEPPSTSHFSIRDAEGRVVSMTTTVEFAFGSHQMAAGFILNNQLTDFSFLYERDGKPIANAVAPGKRPRSSMSPTIVFNDDGSIWGALGSPGGPAIIGYVAKTLIAAVDWEMDLQSAVDYPNIVIPRGDPLIESEKFDDQIKQSLGEMGHALVERDLTSGVHGFVLNDAGEFDGAADPRREGVWKTGVLDSDG
ncbi:MAG: gamma-glutamyltransferase [Pseudomonadota bacterium]